MATKINQLTGMPQMGTTLGGWMHPVTLEVAVQTIDDDGFVVTTKTQTTFQGTVQPLSTEQIQLKPDGQRSWEWLQIHAVATSDLNLKTNDEIVYNGVDYKVMGVYDYSLNAFIEYHLIKDYQ